MILEKQVSLYSNHEKSEFIGNQRGGLAAIKGIPRIKPWALLILLA
jgi:hypothetical protein